MKYIVENLGQLSLIEFTGVSKEICLARTERRILKSKVKGRDIRYDDNLEIAVKRYDEYVKKLPFIQQVAKELEIPTIQVDVGEGVSIEQAHNKLRKAAEFISQNAVRGVVQIENYYIEN